MPTTSEAGARASHASIDGSSVQAMNSAPSGGMWGRFGAASTATGPPPMPEPPPARAITEMTSSSSRMAVAASPVSAARRPSTEGAKSTAV